MPLLMLFLILSLLDSCLARVLTSDGEFNNKHKSATLVVANLTAETPTIFGRNRLWIVGHTLFRFIYKGGSHKVNGFFSVGANREVSDFFYGFS